jgi:hypothetical protein
MGRKFAVHLQGCLSREIERSIEAKKKAPVADEGSLEIHAGLQAILTDKMRLAEALRLAFSRHFWKSLEEDGREGRDQRSTNEGPQGGFSLIDDQQLEEWLVIDNLTAKVQQGFAADLSLLHERFRYLSPRSNINKYRLPLGVDKFCHAFQDAFEDANLDIKTRLHCYGVLENVIRREIGKLYSTVNQFLASRGVLATLKPSIQGETAARSRTSEAKSRVIDVSASDPDSRTAAEPSGRSSNIRSRVGHGVEGTGADGSAVLSVMTGGSMSIRQQTFEAVRTLLCAHLGRPGTLPEEPAAVYSPVTPMLVDTLSALQHDDSAIERSGELIRGGLRPFVHGRYSAINEDAQGARINQIDDETIEVISMIFAYILDDHSLSAFMKALIGRLQIPILKVAILDRTFFSRKDHPARQLLNQLAQAGAGWRDESEAAKDRLYEKLESIVRRVLNEFENNVEIFDVLLEDLRGFLAEETRRFDQAQQELLAAAREEGRAEIVKAQIAKDITARLFGREVPEDLRDFFVVSWRRFLTTVTLEEGEGSETRRLGLQLIDDLLWSLTPKKTAEERRRLIQMLPGLLTTIRDGLSRIQCGEEEIQDVIRVLERHHFISLKPGTRAERRAAKAAEEEGPRGSNAGEPRPPCASGTEGVSTDALAELKSDLDVLPAIDWEKMMSFDDVIDPDRLTRKGLFEEMLAEMEAEPMRDDGPRIEDEFTERVKNLAIGTWVDLPLGDRRVRAKLAWKDDLHGGFSFVNRQFKVISEQPLYVLADLFRRGAATAIDHVGVFDRAVDGVVGGIMKLTRVSTS